MAINTIQAATVFQKKLDEHAVHGQLTGWMDANAGQVIYDGGKDIKIPRAKVKGLANYDKDNGHKQGAISLDYETMTMTQDRGRKFLLDPVDINESNFVVNATNLMTLFQKDYVIPEIDAYRIAECAKAIIAANVKDHIKYSYTPAESTILREIKTGIKAIRKSGYAGDLVIHANADVMLELEMALSGKIRDVTFSKGGIDTKVPAVDGVPIIETPDNRMYTAIDIKDAVNASDEGGYAKATTAKNINFMILPKSAPIAVSKQDIMRIFTPQNFQNANAWSMDYRRYHDLWMTESKAKVSYINIKEAK